MMVPTVRILRSWVVPVFVLVALAGAVTAQQTELTIELEPGDAEADPGGSVTVQANVTLEVEEFFCAANEDLPVYLRGERTERFVLLPASEELAFRMPSGAAVTTSYTESQHADIELSVARDAEPFEDEARLEAEFPGADPDACGPEAFPRAQSTAELAIEVTEEKLPDEARNGTSDDGGGGDESGEQGSSEAKDTPAGDWTILGAALSASLWARRLWR